MVVILEISSHYGFTCACAQVDTPEGAVLACVPAARVVLTDESIGCWG